MQFITSFLFGISASLDSLLLGMAYGIHGIRIGIRQNILISFITLLGTCLAILCGMWVFPLLPSQFSHFLGSIILILFGVWCIVRFFIQKKKEYPQNTCLSPPEFQINPHKNNSYITLPFSQAIILGTLLSANNIGIGLSASIAGLKLLPAVVITTLFSVIFLFMGNKMGRFSFLQTAGNFADPLSGLLLILLGVFQWFS